MIITLIHYVFVAFELLIFARIIISWAGLSPYSQVAQFLYKTTEPFLAPVRRILPPAGMFDLSPMVVLIIALVLESFLINILRSLI